MGGGGKGAWERPCSEIMVRTALDGPKEWSIIELQGEFETRDPALKTLNGLEIGNLVCKAGSKSVHLVIGNQRLDGKVVDLKEPLAVMSKVTPGPPAQDAAAAAVAAAAGHGGDTEMAAAGDKDGPRQTPGGVGPMEFHIVGLVKRKLVFNHRPTIVTQQPSPTKDLGSQRFV
eukprot:Tamp_33619.p2 GENE.Tamp_33619~~Tamp_33619.p2  ORF type:complete len:181 (+),score=57.05 Tamp_33619:27-545(+)